MRRVSRPPNTPLALSSSLKICKSRKSTHTLVLYQIRQILWSRQHSSWSRVCPKHYETLTNATSGDPYSMIEHCPGYRLWFQCQWLCPMEKNKLNCNIRDLKSEVTCYVIDIDTSYNLLLRWPWIYCNGIVPSTLHQVMKYINEDGEVRTLIVERHLFKGLKIT